MQTIQKHPSEHRCIDGYHFENCSSIKLVYWKILKKTDLVSEFIACKIVNSTFSVYCFFQLLADEGHYRVVYHSLIQQCRSPRFVITCRCKRKRRLMKSRPLCLIVYKVEERLVRDDSSNIIFRSSEEAVIWLLPLSRTKHKKVSLRFLHKPGTDNFRNVGI